MKELFQIFTKIFDKENGRKPYVLDQLEKVSVNPENPSIDLVSILKKVLNHIGSGLHEFRTVKTLVGIMTQRNHGK